jgi:hypothetical protein
MADLFSNLVGEIATGFIKGAVTKAVNGFVAKGEITAAQAPVMVEGTMLEIQVAGEEWQKAQANKPPGS